MTIKEIENIYKGEYSHIEVYAPVDNSHYPNHFHTDNCVEVENSEYSDDSECGLYELMNEEDYESSILANAGISFSDIYEAGENILCVMLK